MRSVLCIAFSLLAAVACTGDTALLGDAIAVGTELRSDTLDRQLLARAIFAETNRVRRGLGLKALKPSGEADEAATIQASLCASRRVLSHHNPMAGLGTPMDRAIHARLTAEVVAENVAVTPLLDLGDADQIGIVRSEGRIRFVDPATGEPARSHTYESFAANLVRRWMDSPGHRRNIVDPQFAVLGCASWPSKSISGADVIYSVQVFATAGKKASKPTDFKYRKNR